MSKLSVGLFLFFMFFCCGCMTATERLYYCAPTAIPDTARQMKSPGFWISRNASADKVIMSALSIRNFNNRIRTELGLTRDIFGLSSSYPGDKLASDLEGKLKSLAGQKLYLKNGSLAGSAFYQHLSGQANLKAIPSDITLRFGFITEYADLRFLPVADGLYAKAFDLDFDELQNSALDIAEPVAVLHKSNDGKWVYVISVTSEGWVEASKVAICARTELNNYLIRDDFAVVVSPKADIFLNHELTAYYDYVQMGTRLPFKAVEPGGRVEVIVPMRSHDGSVDFKICYMNKADINLGYLVYTPRTIITQAFKLLNAPYGWGGMYGEQDCSRFIQQIFGTAGIILPRNSSSQSKVGISLGEFNGFKDNNAEKLRVLTDKACPGTVVLYMKGHIILFLGFDGGKPYGIHALWGYRDKDTVRLINRVAVSGLDLGKFSKKGSLLSRIKAIRAIAQ